MEVSGQLHARLQSRSGLCEKDKNIGPAGTRTRGVQYVVRRYTDWAIPTIARNSSEENLKLYLYPRENEDQFVKVL
jgi:hypothetical protein